MLSATKRTGSDGRQYYDIAIRMTSYASRNPYVVTSVSDLTSSGVTWVDVICMQTCVGVCMAA